LFELHLVDDWVGGVLVWNSEEAYLFSGWSGMGYRFRVMEFLAALVPAYFGASTAPDEKRGCTIVFRITPARIERYVVPDVGFKAYIPRARQSPHGVAGRYGNGREITLSERPQKKNEK